MPLPCPGTPVCSLSLNWLLWGAHVSGITWDLSFSIWLLSLSVTFATFICVVGCVRISFFFKANAPCVYMRFVCPSPIDGHRGCSRLWAAVNGAALDFSCGHLLEHLFSVLWGIFPDVSCWVVW